MEIGNRVRVIKRMPCGFNNVAVNDLGTIVDVGCDLVYVVLDKYKGMRTEDYLFLFKDGSYQFAKDQLEVIEDGTI